MDLDVEVEAIDVDVLTGAVGPVDSSHDDAPSAVLMT
jgi:hypothetical protein